MAAFSFAGNDGDRCKWDPSFRKEQIMFPGFFRTSRLTIYRCPALLLSSFMVIALGSPQQSDPRFKEAMERMRVGKYAEAEQALKPLIAHQPSSEVYSLLGYACELQETPGSLEEAQESYKKSLQLNPRLEFSKVRLGIVYGKAGKFADCVATLSALRPRIDSNAEALFYLCLSHLEKGEKGKALEVATAVERSNQKDAESLLKVVRLLVWKELYPESLPILRKTVDRLPQSPKANYLLALSLFKVKQYDEMQPYLEKAYRLEPESLPTLLLRAAALLEAKKLPEARELVRKAHELATGDPEVRYLECQLLIEEGAYQEAIDGLNKLIRKGSKHPDIYFLLLSAYRRKGDIQETVDYARKLTQVFPENSLAQLNAGLDLQLIRQFQEAEDHLRKAVSLAAKDPEAQSRAKFELASVLRKQGNDVEAMPLLEELVRSEKSEISSRLELGDIYLRMNDYEKSLKVLEEAASLAPKNKRARLLLGKVLTRLDKHEQAREQFKLFEQLESAEAVDEGK